MLMIMQEMENAIERAFERRFSKAPEVEKGPEGEGLKGPEKAKDKEKEKEKRFCTFKEFMVCQP